MRQISVFLTKYSDWISTLVCHIGGQGFTHSSIALDEDETTYYSFNYRGFAVETSAKQGAGAGIFDLQYRQRRS